MQTGGNTEGRSVDRLEGRLSFKGLGDELARRRRMGEQVVRGG